MNIPQGPWYIDDTLTFTVITHRFDTGAVTDADAVPAYRVYEDETGTAILTGNMAKLDDANTTGFYSEQITLSAANGFEVGKSYNIYVSAAVNSVTGGSSGGFKVIATPVAQTGDSFARLGAPVGASISVDIAAVATQATDILSLVESIAVTGAAIYNAAVSSTLVTGSLSSGTFASTATADGVSHVHTDTAGAIEVIYDFEEGAGEVGVEVLFRGRVNSANDSILVQAYDWVGADWETLWTQVGVGGSVDTNRAEPLLAKHTGTGGDDGKVRIRFYAASGLTSATLYVDQLLVAKAETLSADVAAILADTNELQTDWANGGRLDLIADAIKAKTDNLTFTVAGQVDSNVQRVNDEEILGDGTGTPFYVA